MNIFVLDKDPILAAQYQCDKHVVKMTLETTQLLSNAVILNGGVGPYRLTHKNHPSTKWASKSRSNFEWLTKHGLALAQEYTYRYGKQHKCHEHLARILEQADKLPDIGITEFALAMPDNFKTADPVQSYRNYYIGAKANISKWTKRNKPEWWIYD